MKKFAALALLTALALVAPASAASAAQTSTLSHRPVPVYGLI
jgi:hypothetical protein